jgi:hypothetical protein
MLPGDVSEQYSTSTERFVFASSKTAVSQIGNVARVTFGNTMNHICWQIHLKAVCTLLMYYLKIFWRKFLFRIICTCCQWTGRSQIVLLRYFSDWGKVKRAANHVFHVKPEGGRKEPASSSHSSDLWHSLLLTKAMGMWAIVMNVSGEPAPGMLCLSNWGLNNSCDGPFPSKER